MIKLLIKADFGQFWDDPVPKSKFEVKVSETKKDPVEERFRRRSNFIVAFF